MNCNSYNNRTQSDNSKSCNATDDSSSKSDEKNCK